ncbi:PIN domain-containing protein [Picrophilus oshimae]|uniref:hypothetical protein n=1 Tax=Picrophilus oshimae TaxID=46632 RepID=UPI0009FECD10|nr:hypothetical protein [Picrophilus oshimae]
MFVGIGLSIKQDQERHKISRLLNGLSVINFDEAVGLDESVLGEEIHPKVFGIIRRIKDKDEKVFAELERDIFGGGELFYQPLKDFLKNKGVEELEKMPYSVFSGLKKINYLEYSFITSMEKISISGIFTI